MTQNIDEIFTGQPLTYAEDIPCYDTSEFFYRELDVYRLHTLLEIAKHKGWKTAATAPINAYVTRYITDPSRVLFLNLVTIKNKARILDLGAGWGTVALQIAKRYPDTTVYAIDKTLEGLLFLNIIKKEEKLSNVRLARCTADALPIMDNTIDTVLMIGVLEWVAVTMREPSPRTAQIRVLREARRVLKEGGNLVIGIENQYGYQYFKGKREHSGILYGSILPKKIVDLYSRKVLHRSYRTYIYSRKGYDKILKDAGFEKIKFFCAYPDYRFPSVICDEHSVREMMKVTHKKGIGRILSYFPSFALGKIVPSYYILVEK